MAVPVPTTRVADTAAKVETPRAWYLLKHGQLQAADRDVMARYVGRTGAALDARIDAAVAEVQQ